MEKPRYTIAMLVCYYGSFPWYFKYFIHSCKFNPTIDFLIFTDIEQKEELPPNIQFIPMPLPKLKKIISDKLGYTVNIDSSYKLCDYKPVLGLTLSDFIIGYDFWGQCDIDIIYGDIRGFLNDDVLNEYDFISGRDGWTTGYFSVFRNNNLMNNVFKRGKDCKKIFTDAKYWAFDEFNFLHKDITEENTIWDIETEVETFTTIIKKANEEKEIKAYFEFIAFDGVPGKLKFDKGKLIFKNTYEGILYHLYWLKKIYHPVKVPAVIPDIYFVSSSRIYF